MSLKKNILKYTFYLFFSMVSAISQDDVLLESYNHGEGIRFSQGDDYNFRIRVVNLFSINELSWDNEIGNIDGTD